VSNQSIGQKLFKNFGFRQGSYFLANQISEDTRSQWIDGRSQANYRKSTKTNKIPESSLLVITSQNCDIACRTDSDDSCIEIAVFKKINKKKVFPGNQFVKSVRKLHINVDENWYEAKVAYIFVVDKIQLHELFEKIGAINYLPEEHLKAIPLWRANRYLRTALPDNLDHEFKQVLSLYLNKLEAETKQNDGKSYIRALYILLDSEEEKNTYQFDLFALMKESTPDTILTEAQDIIESMTLELIEKTGYTEGNGIYADRDVNTFVSYLTPFIRVNLDHNSLAKNDDEIGFEC